MSNKSRIISYEEFLEENELTETDNSRDIEKNKIETAGKNIENKINVILNNEENEKDIFNLLKEHIQVEEIKNEHNTGTDPVKVECK